MSPREDHPMTTSGVHEKVSWGNHERLVRLETNHEHMTKQVDAMAEKVDEMHEVLLQARGVRWLIIIMATIGGFLASKIGTVIPWPK